MKTIKKTSEPKKASKKGASLKSKNIDIVRPYPSEDDIRKKATEIYHERIVRGENGSAVEDWLEAEAFLCGSDTL